MRRRIFWIIIGTLLALITIAAGTAAALPTTRHIVSALWNMPDRLPALPENSQVHFEAGASMQPVGVAPFGRVVLSPVLGAQQRRRLPAILTHEMSHAHIQGWISAYAFVRLPNWFKEGLAVMVSGGGGAEFASEAEARAAIERGEHFAINDTGSIFNLSEIRFEREPPPGTRSHQIVTAYRQAAMFVAWLHDTDAPGFARMMDAILSGHSFVQAVDTGYHQDVRSLWQKFVQTGATRK